MKEYKKVKFIATIKDVLLFFISIIIFVVWMWMIIQR